MSEIIKTGNLLKFSDNTFNSKWKYVYVELYRNSTFRWFEKKGDSSPKRSIILKNVSAFLAFGDIVKQLPFKPDLKPEQVDLVIAIPHENNRNTRLSFFLCSNESEIKDWVNTMLNTVTDSLPEKPTGYSETNNPPVQSTNIPSGGPYGGPSTCPTTAPQYPATSYGGPPAYNYPGYNQPGGPPPIGNQPGGPPPIGNQPGGPPPIGFNLGNPPTGGYPAPSNFTGAYPPPGNPAGGYPPPGNPAGGYHPPGNPAGGYHPPGNPVGGYHPPGNPAGAYSAPCNPPTSYQTPGGYNPGMAYSNYPRNPPPGQTTGYHAGTQAVSYPRQPGYTPGVQQSYVPGMVHPYMTQNPPIGSSGGYQPGVVSNPYELQQTGYVPGAPPTHFRGQSYIATQPAQTYVIVDGKKKKKHRKLKNAAIGVAAGAATAYAAQKMFGGHHGWGHHGWGHGWGGHGWGHGGGHHWGGSWSSLSSGSWSD